MFKLNYLFANRMLYHNWTIILRTYFTCTHCTKKDWELGIRDNVSKSESMTMCTNDFVFMDLHIMPLMFVISLTHKHFHRPAFSPTSVYFLYFGDTALTFAGNTCLMEVCIDILTWYSDLVNRYEFSHSHFTLSWDLCCFDKQGSAHFYFG